MLFVFSKLRSAARRLKGDTLALYYAVRDPRTPWYAKLIAGAVVAYALSPIDLIPDFIPVLGYLDDIVLVPLGIALAIRLIPEDVLAAARIRAAARLVKPRSRVAAAVVIVLWIGVALALTWWTWTAYAGTPVTTKQ